MIGFHVLRHDCSQISVSWKRDCGPRAAQGISKLNKSLFFCFPRTVFGRSHFIKVTLIGKGGTRNPHKALSITASLFSSPPLFAMLTSFQFTQSALPTQLAALFPCDSCWPIAAQAHLVPCEAGASLHYITAATGCHGNTHGHYHTVLVCMWNITLCWMCIDTGFPPAWKIIESLWIWRKIRT